MSCTIHNCEQRTDEWFQLRKGILTASEMGAWLHCKDKRGRTAWDKMIAKKVAQKAGAWEKEHFEDEIMRRGTDLEPQAVESFEKATGEKITEVGFCQSTKGLFGCSPDGLIMDSDRIVSGLEGKIPLPSTHIYYRRNGALPQEYFYQVHGSMAVTGAKTWWFQCWNPGLAPFRMLVSRNDQTEEILERLQEFSEDLKIAIKEESAAWKAEFNKKAL